MYQHIKISRQWSGTISKLRTSQKKKKYEHWIFIKKLCVFRYREKKMQTNYATLSWKSFKNHAYAFIRILITLKPQKSVIGNYPLMIQNNFFSLNMNAIFPSKFVYILKIVSIFIFKKARFFFDAFLNFYWI